MAKAITHIEKQRPNQAEEQMQALTEILTAVSNNRQSILVFLDILKEVHAAGLLDIVQGVLKNRHQVGVIAISQLNQPAMHHMLKNGMTAMEFLGKLEPERLANTLNAVAKGVERFSETEEVKPTGLWSMTKALRDPDVGISITAMMNFLRGMGEELSRDQEPVN